MTRRLFLFLGVLICLIGCGAEKPNPVVGIWKGKLPAPAKIGKDSERDIEAGIQSALAGETTFEFDADGRYRTTSQLGTGLGGYTVEGNTVVLTPDGGGGATKVFTFNGNTMKNEVENSSDPVLVLTKQPPSR